MFALGESASMSPQGGGDVLSPSAGTWGFPVGFAAFLRNSDETVPALPYFHWSED